MRTFRSRLSNKTEPSAFSVREVSGDAFDKAVVEKTLHEDKNAFRGIVEKYTPQFLSLAVKMSGGDLHAAEEAVQEIFLKIFNELERYDTRRRFFSWAYTIAVNFLRSEMRKSYVRQQKTSVPYDDTRIDNSSNYANPESEVMQAEGERLVLKALKQLKPKYHDVFILRQIQGLSVSDTAEVMDIPEGTVKTFMFRARKAILAALKRAQWQ